MITKPNKSVQIYGPFSTAYSLSEVNRGLGIALMNEGFDVSFVDDIKLVDRYPKSEDYKEYPQIKSMIKSRFHADIGIWNRYPYDHLDLMDCDIKILSIAWEPSLLPFDLVSRFNTTFHLILAKSDFTKQALIRSGIAIPIQILPDAIDIPKLEESKNNSYKIATQKSFKFLNISSGLPRKGLDILIDAYFQEFNSNDDVTLILKTNAVDLIDIQIEKLKIQYGLNSPEIVRIRGDINVDKLLSMYYKSNAYVCPTRCEGFNLPALQAMYANLPVIATNYSGHLDFLNPDNAYLIDYELTDASAAFNIPGVLWAQPYIQSLRSQMRAVTTSIDSSKIDNAFENSKSFTWQNTARKFKSIIDEFDDIKIFSSKNLGVFTTWNTKCGIAEYSRYFYTPIKPYFKSVQFFATKAGIKVQKDDIYVSRIWDELQEIDMDIVAKEILDKQINIFHIQYNSGFYNLAQLSALTQRVRPLCEKVFVTMHSLEEMKINNGHKNIIKSVEILNTSTDAVFVHRDEDLKLLNQHNSNNARVIAHGNTIYPDEDFKILRNNLNISSKHVISSHGFIFPDKGYIESIKSIEILKKTYPDILYIIAGAIHSSNASSSMYYAECLKEIKRLKIEQNVIIIKDFLTLDEIMAILHTSDVIVMMRKNTSNEGASGAIRFPLTSNRPVIINRASIFKDVEDLTIAINEVNPQEIALTISKVFMTPNIYKALKPKITEKLARISWENISHLYINQIYK